MSPINTAFLLVLFVGCALARGGGFNFARIIGGQAAVARQFPHQVSLRSRDTNSHFCGGSIISPRFILTAAHCFKNIQPIAENVYVMVGSISLRYGGTQIFLNQIEIHDEYIADTYTNDIALLGTNQDIGYSESVQPIALPTELPPTEGGLAVTVSGWGYTEYPSSGRLPDTLQFFSTETLSLSDCQDYYRDLPAYARMLSETNLCTYNPIGQGTCNGDSGGPLISNDNILVGVVSWGKPCAEGYPDTYTNVYLYLDWIYARI